MKKKIIAAVTLTAVLVTALGAALAAPGTGDDPFVTRSYLTGAYYAQAEQAMLQQAQAATAETEQAALDKLEALAESYLARANGGSGEYAGSFLRLTLSRGDRLELPTGAGLLFEEGRGTLSFSAGTLVDVTGGSTVAAGGTLTAGHRYVAAENTVCSFTAVTDAVILSVLGPYELTCTGITQTPFTDLADGDWYYPYARFAYENGMFQGVTATQFSPNTTMNRAMLATVLCRLAGEQGTVPGAGFTDVADGAWYADAVNWAAAAGVITGYEDGSFRPLADVKRSEMAAMLFRYAKDYLGLDVPVTGDLSAFSDRSGIPSWAEEALTWAVGAGILTGYEDGALRPGGTATRAEVATMLQRFSGLI